MVVDSLAKMAAHDSTHQIAGGTVVASTSLISSTDINTLKAVIISAVLSALAQLVISTLKKLAARLNGNITIKNDSENQS